VFTSNTLLEPGVFGIFRPVLLLPAGITDRLTPEQLQAILAHELCHVRRRDNLTAAVHMVVEAIFWFHPLVWWIGRRLVDERERACDEEVLRSGNPPVAYAEGILNVCRLYVESPLACASGVTGSDLGKRIESIMTEGLSNALTPARKILLAAAGVAAVAGPVLVGVVNAAAPAFEVASIRPANRDARGVIIEYLPGGGLRMVNVALKDIIAFAWDVPRFLISGAPPWLESSRFDIQARPAPSEAGNEDETRRRLQTLLAERCRLAIRRDSKEMPVYALVAVKNGPKLRESSRERDLGGSPGRVTAEGLSMPGLAKFLTGLLKRPVDDHTGLSGKYDFTLEWIPEGRDLIGKGGGNESPVSASAPDPSGPSLFTAIQQQLGLKLESRRGPVEIIVIDRVEQPSEN
jgi:uncharacterized protein (TIGR03435 family)